MRSAFKPDVAAGLSETYELHVGGQVFEVRVEYGRCTTSRGRAHNPDAVMTMSVITLNALLKNGQPPPREALARGEVKLEGDPQAMERFVRVFALDQRD